MPGTTFPPEAPQIDGTKLTVDLLLKSPPRIQRRIASLLNERLIVDNIYSAGPQAVGGAVVYDRVLESDLYTERDVQEIEPGSEFPILDAGEVGANVAKVAKRGGMIPVTYEAQRRNQLDVLNRQLTRLTNTITKKVDTVGTAVLLADPLIPHETGSDWTSPTAGDPVEDLMGAAADVSNQDLGYNIDTWLINPRQELSLFLRKDVREALPRENPATNPLLSGKINGFLGFNYLVSNRVPVGTAIGLNGKVVGSWSDELPLYSRVVNDEKAETWWIMAARVGVPVITDPLSARIVTGLGS